MEINRNNYEVFLIDYLDGNLSPEMVAELLLFLESNPDLKEEFEGMEDISVVEEEIIPIAIGIDFKESLKKPVIEKLITKENYEEYFIASLEGDLAKKEQKELVDFLLKNPELSKEFKLFKQTFLVPETEIKFSNKSSIKKIIVEAVDEIGQHNYEEFFIADIEGDLDLNKKHNLKVFLQANPQLKKEYDIFRNTVLTPDFNIVYDDKRSLKKAVLPVFTRKTIYYSVSIAASILILLSIFLSQPKTPISNLSLAERKQNSSYLKFNKSSIEEATDNVSLNKITNNTAYAENPVKAKSRIRNTQNINEVNSIPSSELLASTSENINQIDDERDFYTSIYYEFLSAEYYRNLAQNDVESKDEHSTLAQYGLKRMRLFLNRNNEDYQIDNTKFSLWEVADAGLIGFNRLSNKNIKLDKETDEYGKVISYAVVGDSFQFKRK
ncbi:MAG: hypothetical protein K9J13_11685 [Saprospiraceae bacterium]|nr:hypothetical protein [Saprospiraceae bacterium]